MMKSKKKTRIIIWKFDWRRKIIGTRRRSRWTWSWRIWTRRSICSLNDWINWICFGKYFKYCKLLETLGFISCSQLISKSFLWKNFGWSYDFRKYSRTRHWMDYVFSYYMCCSYGNGSYGVFPSCSSFTMGWILK